MHLYLSSYRMGRAGKKLKELTGGGTAYIISNALDFSKDVQQCKAGIERELKNLGELGITAEPLDLRDFFGKSELLARHLSKAKMVWVVGGNTFLLRQAMKRSGLDQFLYTKVDDVDFVYAGYSAGICVLSPSLIGFHLADEPEAKADGYVGPALWTGLGLIDYYIVPHFRCDHFESEKMEAVVEYYQSNSLPYRTIADGDVILDSTHNREQADAVNRHSAGA